MLKEHIQNLTNILWVSSSDIHCSLLVYGGLVIYFTGIRSFLFHKSEKKNTIKARYLIRKDTQSGFRKHLVCKWYSGKETTNYAITHGQYEYMATSRSQIHCLQPRKNRPLKPRIKSCMYFHPSTLFFSSSTMEFFHICTFVHMEQLICTQMFGCCNLTALSSSAAVSVWKWYKTEDGTDCILLY